MVWRSLAPSETDTSRDRPIVALRLGFWSALLTGIAALAAAGGEIWRYALMLRGRTDVLSGRVVRASDLYLTIAASAALVLSLITAIVIATALVRLHAGAARRAGLEPSRPAASVLARLVVPGWNVWGLGVVAGEVDGLLSAPSDRTAERPRLSRLVLVWWVVWVIDVVLVLVTLVCAFGTSDQAVADTVELHIFVDLIGAVVAVLAACVCRRFLRLLRGPTIASAGRWVVVPPKPTRTSGEKTSWPLTQTSSQPAMVSTAPGKAMAGPKASQATVSASASGDQWVEEAPEPTTTTPMP